VAEFTGDVGNDIDTGPVWGLTVNVQPTNILGFEVGYDGSRNGIADDALPDGSLTRYGASGLVTLARLSSRW